MSTNRILDIHQHLKSRWVDFSIHRPFLDVEGCKATFLLYNLSGQIVGKQEYNPNADKTRDNNFNGRYRTIKTTNETHVVFGLETFNFHQNNPVYVTEGIFDATRLTFYGHTAIAILGNSQQKHSGLKSWLSSIGKTTIAVCDSDKAGLQLAKLTDKAVILNPKHGKDLGELSPYLVLALLSLKIPHDQTIVF